MPSIFEFDAKLVGPQNFIIMKDKDGREYRIRFDSDGGFTIIKASGIDVENSIFINPLGSNQIHIK